MGVGSGSPSTTYLGLMMKLAAFEVSSLTASNPEVYGCRSTDHPSDRKASMRARSTSSAVPGTW